MKLSLVLLAVLSANIFAQNNFTLEWQSPPCYSVGYSNSESTNSVGEIVMYQPPYIKILDGATKIQKYQYNNPDTSTFYFNFDAYNRYQLDVDHDGVFEIISVKQYYSPNYSYTAKVINGATGAVMYSESGTGYLYNYLYDIDGDGYIELLWMSNPASGQSTMKIISTTATPIAVEQNSKLIKDYKLGQNYPNPFNPSTTIEYTVSKDADIDLNIYNEIGQVVKNISEGNKKAGDYKIQIDCSDMASGVYFYQIVVNGTPEAKKMVLVK